MPEPSSFQRLVERSFDGDLPAWVHEQRDRDRSWRSISKELLVKHDIDVTHETLRAWYDQADRASA